MSNYILIQNDKIISDERINDCLVNSLTQYNDVC